MILTLISITSKNRQIFHDIGLWPIKSSTDTKFIYKTLTVLGICQSFNILRVVKLKFCHFSSKWKRRTLRDLQRQKRECHCLCWCFFSLMTLAFQRKVAQEKRTAHAYSAKDQQSQRMFFIYSAKNYITLIFIVSHSFL